MDFKALCNSLLPGWRLPKQTLLIMKLTAIFLVAACLQVSAKGYSQTVTLNERDVSLQKVFVEIHKQTGFQFFYNDEVLDEAGKISISVKDIPVEDVLKLCFKDMPFAFKIVDNTIIVRKLPDLRRKLYLNPKPVLLPVDITGTVVNENGEPVPGATVTVKGTGNATATNANGFFELKGVEEKAVLVITSVNIETYEVSVNGRTNLKINVRTKIKEEEVVIAYGVQKRKDLTGSVSTITGKTISELGPTTNIEQALQGQAAGVMVLQESGQPGSATRVRIRGSSSLLGSNQPLYVVDGIPVVAEGNIPDDGSATNTALIRLGLNSPLNNISPELIESITILKDASATAIYGSRAANGVVIITTKNGSLVKKPAYTFTSSISTQKALTDKALNAQQFREIWTEAAQNSTSTAAIIQEILDGSYFGDADTDWEKELSPANPLTKNIGFSISGGSEKIRYFSSLNFQDQQGSLANAFFKRYSFLVKLDLAASEKVNLGTSVNLSSSLTGAPDNGLLTRLYTFRPDLPVYDETGQYAYSDYNNFENPVALSKATNTNGTVLLLGSVYGELKFARDFKFRSVLSMNYNAGNFKSFYPSFTTLGGFTRATGPGPGVAQESKREMLSHLWENTVTYNRYFAKKHSVNAVVGAAWQGDNDEFLKASGEGFPQDDVLNNLSSATQDFIIASNKVQSGLISFFGRVNYVYDNRYMLTLSARADGSSKFAEENKWAFFPTIAGAWVVSNEKFFQQFGFIDDLKLRASTGLTGQATFGAYQWRTLFDASSYGGQPAVVQTQLGNSRLKWELTDQFDAGIDFSFFNRRLSGSFDYYVKNTSDLLYFFKMPGNTGTITAIGNLGNTQNKGVELSLEGDIIRRGDFTWTLNINVSHNKNKLVSLNDDYLDKSNGFITPPNTGSKLQVGQPMGLIYGYVSDGIFQTQAEVDALNNATGGGFYQAAGTAPGDIKFKDLNGDRKVTALDQTVIGKAMPELVGGFSNILEFRGFRLSTLFTYSIGNDLRWGTQATGINIFNIGSENKLAMIMNRWTPQNPTNQPRVVYGDPNGNNRVTDFYVYDGSYLRMKSLYLSYTFPERLLSRTKVVKSAELYVSGTNLFTVTKYPGANPETSNLYNDDVSAGLDNSRFPISKVYTIGVRMGL